MELQWTSSLSVGVDEIDRQHQELISKLNDLRTAMSEGRGIASVKKTASFLADYVMEHFSSEEKYMARYEYPDFSYHKSQHTHFIKDLAEFKKQLDRVEAEGGIASFLVVDLQRHLADWLVNHIGIVDKALGSFLQSRL